MMEAREGMEVMKEGGCHRYSDEREHNLGVFFFFLNQVTSHLANLLLRNKYKKR